MGCRGHRILQGTVPFHIRNSLSVGKSGDTGCHTGVSGILTVRDMKRIYECGKAGIRLAERGACMRQPFFFTGGIKKNGDGRNRKTIRQQSDNAHPDELPGKGSGRFLSAGKVGALRFREKSSSPCSGIFPENLACRKHPLLPPYSSTGHAKPEYSQLKMKRVWKNKQSWLVRLFRR